MRAFLYFFLIAAFLSCDRESIVEKEVNAEYKSLQRKWQFVTMETAGAGADSVSVELTSASVDWSAKCKYTDEGGNYNLCGGKGDFNGLEVTYAYGYDATEGKYILRLNYPGQNTKEQYILGRKLDGMINGRWEFEVTGETFTATQTNNERLPGVLTTLTAKAL